MKIESMLMAAGIWALGSVSAFAQGTAPAAAPAVGPQDGAGVEEEEAPPAAPPPATEPAPVTPLPAAVPPAEPAKPFRIGASVLLGGGYEDFSNSNVRQVTGGGGTWDARVVAGTRQYVGLEAAYVGSARSVNTLGLNPDTNLVSNGFEGDFRINIPVTTGQSLIEPFGFAGVGWQHYSLTNVTVNTSDIADKDDIMTVPYGGGLEYSYAMFMADARFTYRQTYNNDMFGNFGGAKLNTWGLSGKIGVEF
jgi:hypothetical protein